MLKFVEGANLRGVRMDPVINQDLFDLAATLAGLFFVVGHCFCYRCGVNPLKMSGGMSSQLYRPNLVSLCGEGPAIIASCLVIAGLLEEHCGDGAI